MSRILHLIKMDQRYLGSKGVRETRLEEPPLTHLAAPSDLEENASHHHSRAFLGVPKHHLNAPGSSLGTSILTIFMLLAEK